MGSRKHVDFVSAILFIALSVYVIYEGYNYYQGIQVRGAMPFYESPGFFPIVIGSGLLICSVMLLVRSLKGGAFTESIKNIKEGSATFLKSPAALRALIGSGWMGLYVFFLLENLGFRVGSILFLVGLMLFLQWKKILSSDKKTMVISLVKIATISIISVFVTYIVFQQIFRAPLP